MGVDVGRISALGFGIGAALAGLAGGLLITISAINSGIGTAVSIKAFIMIMIGGAGVVARRDPGRRSCSASPRRSATPCSRARSPIS